MHQGKLREEMRQTSLVAAVTRNSMAAKRECCVPLDYYYKLAFGRVRQEAELSEEITGRILQGFATKR
jgi:hypothetical protein